jgi:hypothetical protein
MTQDVEYRLQEMKKYVQGMCYPFFQNYKRIVDSQIASVTETLDEIRNSGLVEINENIGELEDRADATEIAINQLNSSLTNLKEVTVPDINNRVIEIDEVKIPSLKTRATNLEFKVSDILDNRLVSMNESISENFSAIENLTNNVIPTISDRTDMFSDTLDNYGTEINANKMSIDNINATLNNHNNRILSNDTDIDNINTTLSDHDTRITTNKNSIDTINNTTIPTLRNTIEDTLNDHDTRILENLNSILNINALLASDDTALDELQEIVNFIKLNRADLDSLTITSIAGLSASLSDLQNQINTNDTDISTINTKLVTTSTLNTLQKITDYITTTRAYANNANSKIDGLLGSKSLLHATDPLRVSGNYIYLYRADGTYDRIYVNMSAITTVSSSFGVKGYMRLSNNFIIQWGTDIPGEDVWWNYNFPLTFPHAARSIVASGKEGYTSTDTEVQASIIDQARYRLRANAYHNRYVHWIAIGY